MTYRVRRQAFTGKLVLQHMLDGWQDVQQGAGAVEAIGEFIMCEPGELRALHQRIAKYERRAASQRRANEARKAAKTEVLMVGPQERS